MWVLGTKCESSARTVHSFNVWAISPPTVRLLYELLDLVCIKLTKLTLDCFHTALIMGTVGFCCCCLPQMERGLRMWLCVEHNLVLPGLSSSLFLPVPSCSTLWKLLAWFRAGLLGGALAHTTLKSNHFMLKIEQGVNFPLTFWCSLSGLVQWLGKDPLVSCIQGVLAWKITMARSALS